MEKTGGDFGGHLHAAGAVIPSVKEKEFIDGIKKALLKYAIEEYIVEN